MFVHLTSSFVQHRSTFEIPLSSAARSEIALFRKYFISFCWPPPPPTSHSVPNYLFRSYVDIKKLNSSFRNCPNNKYSLTMQLTETSQYVALWWTIILAKERIINSHLLHWRKTKKKHTHINSLSPWLLKKIAPSQNTTQKLLKRSKNCHMVVSSDGL